MIKKKKLSNVRDAKGTLLCIKEHRASVPSATTRSRWVKIYTKKPVPAYARVLMIEHGNKDILVLIKRRFNGGVYIING